MVKMPSGVGVVAYGVPWKGGRADERLKEVSRNLREGIRTSSDGALCSSIQCFDSIDRAQSYRAKGEEKARVEQKKESGREVLQTKR